MDEFIKRNKLLKKVRLIKSTFSTPLIIREIENAPKEDVVSIELYNQIKAERDAAFKLLKQHNIKCELLNK